MLDQINELTLPIAWMGCAGCATTIEKALNGVPGVAEANVNLATGRVSVRFAEVPVPVEELVIVVRRVGYDVLVGTETLSIVGMTCGGCADRVEGALTEVDGVVSASVNLSTRQATIVFVPGVTGPNAFRTAVAATDYQALSVRGRTPARRKSS